jgi:hypothetical protein
MENKSIRLTEILTHTPRYLTWSLCGYDSTQRGKLHGSAKDPIMTATPYQVIIMQK